MTPPYWITPIQAADEKRKIMEFTFPAAIHRGQLLEAYLKMREAVEKAPHEKWCETQWLGLPEPQPCYCYKAEALAYDPTKEVN